MMNSNKTIENYDKIKEYVLILGELEESPKLDLQIKAKINEILTYCYRYDVSEEMELPLAEVILSGLTGSGISAGLDENIELGKPPYQVTLDPPPWVALGTPNADYNAQIPFLQSLYEWVKAHHQRYILSIGDYVAVQKLGNNTYIILQKVRD